MITGVSDIKIFNPKKWLCDHRPTSPKTTINFLRNVDFMVFPKHVYGVCTKCGKSFDFITDPKTGKLINSREGGDSNVGV